MAIPMRWTIGILLALSLLTACTRRSDEPVVLADDVQLAPATEVAAPVEPEIQTATALPEGAAPATLEATAAGAEADATAGAEAVDDLPLRPTETFQYTVQEGDNLSYLAEKFGTTMQTLRELNFLTDDNIQAGAILVVPYVEGITAEGLPTPVPGPFEYTVQQGDTLGDIALRFNVNPIRIIEANQLLTPDSLVVGTTLLIPGYVPDAPATADTAGTGDGATAGTTGDLVTYTVQQNDTFFSIAQAFDIDPNELAAANSIVDRDAIRIGQVLVIPGLTVREDLIRRGQTHVIAGGETLSGIAAQYGVTVDDILTLNNMTDADAIIVGQQLLIPGP